MKILIVDGQVFQTEARDRGMGRYSARLVNSIIKQGDYDEVRLVLALTGHTNHLTEQAARRIFPHTKIVYLDLHNNLRGKIRQVQRKNKLVLDAYVDNEFDKDTDVHFLIPSPFQEPVVSIYPDRVKKVVVFYDLIPYLYHMRYEPLMRFSDYLKRFNLLFEADIILAISQSVRDDLMEYLGLLGERIFTIDGAAIRSALNPVRPSGLDLPSRYILMPTSDDPRKNNLRAVVGFEEFRMHQEHDYKLIITSKIHQSERRRLELFSKNIIFTGNMRDEEMDWLYGNCEAVLFVSESEGLGLPILEAVHTGKKVVCSDLNVFKEISRDAFYYCDYEDQRAIAAALIRACQVGITEAQSREYTRILKHYSWKNTGQRAVHAMDGVGRRRYVEKKKIAIFTPRPDGLSAVGKVVAEAHATLSEEFDIDYYAEQGLYNSSTRPNFLQYIAKYFDASQFGVERYSKYEAVFYHIGNSDYHVRSISNALYLPGFTILHDTNIGEAYRIMREQDLISAERYEAEQRLNSLLKTKNSSFLGSLMKTQRGALVHSGYALGAAIASGAQRGRVVKAQLGTNTPDMGRDRDYSGNLVVGLAGILADIKGVNVLVDVAAKEEFRNFRFRLFGYNFTTGDTLTKLTQYENISVSTNLTDFEFQNSLGKLDVFVNYRLKYQGEASLSTIEAMRQGVVVIVRNVGWYAELPDNTVVKINTEADVARVLRELAADPAKLKEISSNAKAYVQTNHTNREYAKAMKRLAAGGGSSGVTRVVSALQSGGVRKPNDLLVVSKRDRKA